MSNANLKLEQLTNYLGSKKLKQLGLLICNSCNEIALHVPKLLPALDLDSKAYITPEEITSIREQLSASTSQFISKPISPIQQPSSELAISSSHNRSTSTLSTPISSEEDLLKQLVLILNQSRSARTESIDIGYTYNLYPPQPPYSLICSECGKQYAIAHPTLELVPLPTLLTDSEYELIKGVYVDILL